STRIAKHLFTAAEYHRMAEAGILGEDDRVELIEGEIVDMAPRGSRHAASVRRSDELFSKRLTGSATVSTQCPIQLGAHSEPELDLCLLRRRDDYYAAAHPRPEDVLLVLEVADTSLAFDLEVKLPLYARARIPEVWVVDLNDDCVQVYRNPASDT
ncbi:MAG TPA: Uma2 family endonuclease, partial [Dehalococcoidia bacterium]|nr:Uma2 family endonuclease [Dehalococcoidia bacterium]